MRGLIAALVRVTLSVGVVLSACVLTAVGDSNDAGTNGAGTYRMWNPSKVGEPSFGAEFYQVANGNVTLSVPIRVSWYYKYGRFERTIKRPVHYPLASFSASDRRWIEELNPTETSLISPGLRKAGPKNPVVGTLNPKSGLFRVKQIVDRDTAIVEYVPSSSVSNGKGPNNGVQGSAGVSSLRLKSKIVRSLKEGCEYDSISCNLVPNYHALPRQEKETYGVDFKVTGRVKKNKEVVYMVEDHR
jgi:hypothetical protein